MRVCLALLGILPSLVAADCDCGYLTQNVGDTENPWVFTDMLETDFTTLDTIQTNADWVRQSFNVSAEAGRGEYGKSFLPENVMARPASANDNDTGLQLRVNSAPGTDSIPVAEIDTARLDLHWGSYRVGMKVTNVEGTCAAFFWYFNDTQEIDVEFLSRQFDHDRQIYPVHLVIQTPASKDAGFDAQGTGTYAQVNLTFDPTTGFHEYRFDYVPGRVIFYADSEMLAEMEGEAVPTSAGHLILQHWSNGNPLWSGGPPDRDALLSVSYVKAYFNSSDATRQAGSARRCLAEESDGAMCTVPDVTAADASTGGWFISRDGDPARSGAGTSQADDENRGCGSRLLECIVTMEAAIAIAILATDLF